MYEWIEFQSIYSIPGAREKFEDLIQAWLKEKYNDPNTYKIDCNPGDDGLDVIIGKLNDPDGIICYQCKWFLQELAETQKDQIRKSFKTANVRNNLKKWILVLPKNFNKNELLWWQEFQKKQNKNEGFFEFRSGEDIINDLHRSEFIHLYRRFWDRTDSNMIEDIDQGAKKILKHIENNPTSVGNKQLEIESEEIKNIEKFLKHIENNPTSVGNKQLEIESEEIKNEIDLVKQELVIKNRQIDSLVKTLERMTGSNHFIGIESRTENKPNLSEPILFSEFYQNKVKTYYQTQSLTLEQLPTGGFTLDFSKDGGKQLQNDLKLYFKGQKDSVKITNKFLKNVKLQIQGKPIFEHNPNHGDLEDQQVALELLQPYERIKIRIDPIGEIIDYPNLDHLEAIIWSSVETGNLIIQNVPLFENPKIKFKIEIDLNQPGENVTLVINIIPLQSNLKNFEEAVVYYKFYEIILSKKWELKIVKDNVVQFSLPNKLPQQELDESDFVFIKKLEIIYKVWKYFEQDFRRLRIDEKLFALEYPYNLDQDSAQTISFLYNKIGNFSFEFNTTLERFLESYFINNNVQKDHQEKVKQDIIRGYTTGQNLYIPNFEIKPMQLFGKSLALKIAGNALIKIEKIDDLNIKQIIKFDNPEVNLDEIQE